MLDVPPVYALGFSAWKRPIVRRFLAERPVKFVRRAKNVPDGATLAVWASGPFRDGLRDKSNVTLLRLEDGFLRSVGLGADLTQPLSWIVDSTGIYYDHTQPSDLENLLQITQFGVELIDRARSLRGCLVAAGLTKYNVGSPTWSGISAKAAGKEVVLVPGQVESDASIAFGAPGLRTNVDLLRAARNMHPNAWIVYKPHPDVVAGLRGNRDDMSRTKRWCDEMVDDAPMAALLDQIDVVHVMTSLAGFEALMRHKRVVCHGVPFYAGWGLTEDVCSIPRRSRRLHLDELVAGALVLYPRYVSRETGYLCSVEQIVTELRNWKASRKNTIAWWRSTFRPLLHRP